MRKVIRKGRPLAREQSRDRGLSRPSISAEGNDGRLRILIADDHEVVRQGLKRILEEKADWEICAEAASGRAAVELSLLHQPDVVVMDLSMPEMHGLEATRQIRKALPQTEVLILTMHESEQLVREVLAAGAQGFVRKSDAGALLLTALESLGRHQPFFTSSGPEVIVRDGGEFQADSGPALRSELTPRERQIVRLVAEGKSSKQVAEVLSISFKTVETHRSNILSKLGLQSVSELVRYAIRNQLIAP